MKHIGKYVVIAICVIMLAIDILNTLAMNRGRDSVQVSMSHAPMNHEPMICDVADGYSMIVIDSCEYIESFNRLVHKGNCRFCVERHRNELKEIIELIKLAKE